MVNCELGYDRKDDGTEDREHGRKLSASEETADENRVPREGNPRETVEENKQPSVCIRKSHRSDGSHGDPRRRIEDVESHMCCEYASHEALPALSVWHH